LSQPANSTHLRVVGDGDGGVRCVCVEHFLLGAPLVAVLRDAGLGVTTGTVNGAAIAERAFAHVTDALSTHRPHGLAAELVERRAPRWPDQSCLSVPMIRGWPAISGAATSSNPRRPASRARRSRLDRLKPQ
jgi:hypothetical protein